MGSVKNVTKKQALEAKKGEISGNIRVNLIHSHTWEGAISLDALSSEISSGHFLIEWLNHSLYACISQPKTILWTFVLY